MMIIFGYMVYIYMIDSVNGSMLANISPIKHSYKDIWVAENNFFCFVCFLLTLL